MNEEILVSVIVCARNEEKYIKSCLNSLITQKNIPGKFEILVIDGMSEDKTREILNEFEKEHQGLIRLFDNHKKVKPPAMNTGFKNARGKYIAICDAHTTYDENYLSTLINLICEHKESVCVGGPIISIGETSFGKATALAMSSYIGVGNPKHRFPDYEGYAEMACFPLFKREVFNLIGYYDERFIINHDDEYCLRMRKAGGLIYLSPKAKSHYYVRNSPGKLFYQYFTYGLWQVATIKKHKTPIAFRQLVPAIFFISLFILLIIGIASNNYFIAFLGPSIYLLTLFGAALPVSFNKNIKIGFLFPLSIIILHLSYAFGFLWGFIKFRRFNK
jgi:succinoglycan biosynthesis protein ExoA